MLELDAPAETGQKQSSSAVRALVRVAAFYGLTLNPQQLVRAHPFDTDEPGTGVLLKMAAGAGLRGKLMRIKRGELARLAKSVPAILLLPNGKAALINRVEHSNGASYALIDEFESERSLSALYDEPRLFEFWSGEVLLLKLGVGDGGRPPQARDGRPKAVFQNTLDRRQHVGRHVVGKPSLLSVVDVGRLGQAGVDRVQGVHQRLQPVGDLPEGGLRLGHGPRGGGWRGCSRVMLWGAWHEAGPPAGSGSGGGSRPLPEPLGWSGRTDLPGRAAAPDPHSSRWATVCLL